MTSISPTFALKAHTLLEGGQPDEAIFLCEQGLELYPDYATAYAVLAKAYRLTGDIRAAVGSIDRGLQRMPLDRGLLRLHSELYTGGQEAQWEEIDRQEYSLRPQNAQPEQNELPEQAELQAQRAEAEHEQPEQLLQWDEPTLVEETAEAETLETAEESEQTPSAVLWSDLLPEVEVRAEETAEQEKPEQPEEPVQPEQPVKPAEPEIELPEKDPKEKPEIQLPEPHEPTTEPHEPPKPEIEIPEKEEPEFPRPSEKPEIEPKQPEHPGKPEIELPDSPEPEIQEPKPSEIKPVQPEQPEIELPDQSPEIELPATPDIELPDTGAPSAPGQTPSALQAVAGGGLSQQESNSSNGVHGVLQQAAPRHTHLRVIESAGEAADMPSLIWRSRNVRLIPGLEFTPLRFESKKDKLYRRTYKIPDPPPFPDFPVEKKKAVRLQPEENKGPLTPLEELARRLEAARIPRVEEEELPAPPSPSEHRPAMVSETIAKIYEMQGATNEAIKAYEALARQKPEQAEAYLKKARELKNKS